MLKRLIRSLLVLQLVFMSMVTAIPQVLAYSNYNDCVQGESISFAPNGNLSDSDLTAIQSACRTEFPARTSSAPRATTQSSRPRTTTSNSPAPSTSVSAAPAASSSSVPSVRTSTSSNPSVSPEVSASTAPQSQSSSNASTTTPRPYGGFVNDSRGLPALDPQQYVNAYQGTAFSRLTSTRDAFGFLTSFALSFIGMVAIMFLIYAGFVYITANGEQAKIDKAKKLIWGTIIGILIVFSVYAVVATLLNISAAVNPGLNIGPLNVGPGGTTLRLP